MAEQAKIVYKRLFELRVFHHYYLDEGSTDFIDLAESDQLTRLLTKYDARSLFDLQPTPETADLLKGLSCTLKNTTLGCLVGAPETIDIPSNAVFEFTLTILDPALANNTALSLLPRKIYEFQLNDKTYRFKENVYVFTNGTGVKRTINGNDVLCLSREFPVRAGGVDYPAESFARQGNTLYQAVRDNTGMLNPDRQQIDNNKNKLPVYVNQTDIPGLVPPAGIVGAPPKGIELRPGIPDAVHALIRIEPLAASNEFSLLQPGGLREPVFEIHFKNRSTVWRYYNKSTGAFNSEEPDPLPLTRFGNAGNKQKPSEGFVKVELTGAQIDGLYSDIYE
ncbi:MAG: hypothetical protein EP344_17665 [Bacteroidetes bacterium]|nr:MAG: hypothetical protein EP344_17665 [Bacteroidota bacterium]